MIRRSLIVLAVLALALLLPRERQRGRTNVTVKGSATQKVPNDAAKLGFSVSKERKTPRSGPARRCGEAAGGDRRRASDTGNRPW